MLGKAVKEEGVLCRALIGSMDPVNDGVLVSSMVEKKTRINVKIYLALLLKLRWKSKS